MARKAWAGTLLLLVVALLVIVLPAPASAWTNGAELRQALTATPVAQLIATPTTAPSTAKTETKTVTQIVTQAVVTQTGALALGQDDWARVQKAGKIVLGTAGDYPPFEFYNSQFALDGFDIALAKALGLELGVDVSFNDYAFDGLLTAVRLGEVDAAIGAISVTPDRQQVVDFTNLYYIGQAAALAGETFTGTVHSPTDMSSTKIGVQRGTTYQAWAQENLVDKQVIPQVNLVSFTNVSAMIDDLRKGAIDIGLMGVLPANLVLKRYPDLRLVGDKFNQQQLAVAVPKGSTLTVPLNAALLTLQSNGTFATLVQQYLQDDPTNVTPDQVTAVVTNTVITTTTVTTTGQAVPCIDAMAYVADLNLDDQAMTAPPIMVPGQNFTKNWRVRNSGTCAWAPDYALAYVQGNRIESSLGGSSVKVGRTVKPGETIDLSARLRAPQVYGTFQGIWQMRTNLAQYFGEVVWVGIQVPDPNAALAPAPLPSVHTSPNLRADRDHINAGECTTIRWDVDKVSAVYFIESDNTQGVTGHEARTVCPTATTPYTIRVVYVDGTSVDYPILISVSGSTGNYSINFWADATTIDAGQCTTLRWDVRNVQAVYLNGEGVPGVSQRDACPSRTTTYTLLVTKLDGSQDSRQETVDVRNSALPAVVPPVIVRFTVSDNAITPGDCVGFDWRTNDADGVNLVRNGGGVIVGGGPGNGSAQDCPTVIGLYEYRLDAYGAGQTSQKVTVNVLSK